MAVNSAILRNAQIKPDLSSFVAYTKSGAEGRILNYYALKAIKLKKGENRVLFGIKTVDFAQNECGNISLPEIVINAEEETVLPFYEIFDIKQIEEGKK